MSYRLLSPVFVPLHFVLTGICYQNSGKRRELLNTSVALRSRYSLFSQMHRGISPPEIVHAEYRKSSCLCTILYIHIHWFFWNKHTQTMISLEPLTCSFPSAHASFCAEDLFWGPWWSATPKSHLTAWWTGKIWHNEAGYFLVVIPTE